MKSLILTTLAAISLHVQAENPDYMVRVPLQTEVHTPETIIVDFGTVKKGSEQSRVVSFLNRSIEPLTISELKVQSGGTFTSIQKGTCAEGQVLAPKAYCSFSININPNTEGLLSSSVTLAHNKANTPDIYQVKVAVSDAFLDLEANRSFILFEPQSIRSESPEETIVLTNKGETPFYILETRLQGRNVSFFRQTFNSCEELLPGQSCEIKYTFKPNLQGIADGRLILEIDGADGPVSIATLSGEGVQGIPVLSEASLNFTPIEGHSSAPREIILTNSGKGHLTVLKTYFSSLNTSFATSSNECTNGKRLEASQSCKISIVNSANSLDFKTDQFIFELGNTATSSMKVQLSSKPEAQIPRLELLLEGDPLGSVVFNQEKTTSILMRSTGNVPVVVEDLMLDNSVDFEIVDKSVCIGALSPSMECEFDVKAKSGTSIGKRIAEVTAKMANNIESKYNLDFIRLGGVLSSDKSTISFSNVEALTAATNSAILRNTGNHPLTLTSLNAIENVSFSGCAAGTVLQEGQSCTLTLTYSPQDQEDKAEKLTQIHTGINTPLSLDLTLKALPEVLPQIKVTSYSCTPSLVQTGSNSTCSVLISNTGAKPLSAISVTSSNPKFNVNQNGCSALAVGQNCLISANLINASEGVNSSSIMASAFKAQPSSLSIQLTGQNPAITLAVQDHNTTTVGQFDLKSHTLTNTGSFPVRLSAIFRENFAGSPISITSSTCPTSSDLNPGASCTIQTRCEPSENGLFSITLAAISTGTASDRKTVRCNSVYPPVTLEDLAINPGSIDFGSVAVSQSSPTRTIVLTNKSVAPVSIGTISLNTGNFADFIINLKSNCENKTLRAAESCSFNVFTTPTNTGVRSSSISIQSSAGNSSISLNVVGTRASLNFIPASIDFGVVAVGASKTESVSIKNSGSAPGRVRGIGSIPPGFTYTDPASCLTKVLNPNEICTLSISFSTTTARAASSSNWTVSSVDSDPFSTSVSLSASASSPSVSSTLQNCSTTLNTNTMGNVMQCSLVLTSTGQISAEISSVYKETAGRTRVTVALSEGVLRNGASLSGSTLSMPPGSSATFTIKTFPRINGLTHQASAPSMSDEYLFNTASVTTKVAAVYRLNPSATTETSQTYTESTAAVTVGITECSASAAIPVNALNMNLSLSSLIKQSTTSNTLCFRSNKTNWTAPPVFNFRNPSDSLRTDWIAITSTPACSTSGGEYRCSRQFSCTPAVAGPGFSSTYAGEFSMPVQSKEGVVYTHQITPTILASCSGSDPVIEIEPMNTLTGASTETLSGEYIRVTNKSAGSVRISSIAGDSNFIAQYIDPGLNGQACVKDKDLPRNTFCYYKVLNSNKAFIKNPSANNLLKSSTTTVSFQQYGDKVATLNWNARGATVLDIDVDTTEMQKGTTRDFSVRFRNEGFSNLSHFRFEYQNVEPVLNLPNATTVVPASGVQDAILRFKAPVINESTFKATIKVYGRYLPAISNNLRPSFEPGIYSAYQPEVLVAEWEKTINLKEAALTTDFGGCPLTGGPLPPNPVPNVCTCKCEPVVVNPGTGGEVDIDMRNDGCCDVDFTGEPKFVVDPADPFDPGELTIIRTTCQIKLAKGQTCKKTVKIDPKRGSPNPKDAVLEIPTSAGVKKIPISYRVLPRASVRMDPVVRSTPDPRLGSEQNESYNVRNDSTEGGVAKARLKIRDTITPKNSGGGGGSNNSDYIDVEPPTCTTTGGGTCSVSNTPDGTEMQCTLPPGATCRMNRRIKYKDIECDIASNAALTADDVYDPSPEGKSQSNLNSITKNEPKEDSNGNFKWADGTHAASCQDYGITTSTRRGSTTDGYYWVGGATPVVRFCAFADGGGWDCPVADRSGSSSRTWITGIPDPGYNYNQVYIYTGPKHFNDYSGSSVWQSNGLNLGTLITDFDSRLFHKESPVNSWRGCGMNNSLVNRPDPNLFSFALADNKYFNFKQASGICNLNGIANSSQCSNGAIITVPYEGARLNRIGDLESFSGQCTGDNTLRRDFAVCFRNNMALNLPANPYNSGIVQYNGYRAYWDGSVAASCKGYRFTNDLVAKKQYTGATGNGVYRIDPDGAGPIPTVDVFCDMTSDGGVVYQMMGASPGGNYHSRDMEGFCSNYGMQLFVPRSRSHLTNALNFYGASQLRIMGIYPKFRGASCVNVPFTSTGCSNWGPLNGGSWYVQDYKVVPEPNGDNDTDSSMQYTYSGTNVDWYNDHPNGSNQYVSSHFVCSPREEGNTSIGTVYWNQGTGSTAGNRSRNSSWTNPPSGASWIDLPASNACVQNAVHNANGSDLPVIIRGASDDRASVHINGVQVGTLNGFRNIYTLSATLKPGRNLVQIRNVNTGGPGAATLAIYRADNNALISATDSSRFPWTYFNCANPF